MPTWQKLTTEEVKDTIYKLAKKGLTPSQIGVILRDSHGVTQVIILILFSLIHRPQFPNLIITSGSESLIYLLNLLLSTKHNLLITILNPLWVKHVYTQS